MSLVEFKEELHPRGGKGSAKGGQFVSKGGGASSSSSRKKAAVAAKKHPLDTAIKQELSRYKTTSTAEQKTPALAGSEKTALRGYVGTSDSMDINRSLRLKQALTPPQQKIVDAMDALAAKGSLSDNVLLYRYVNLHKGVAFTKKFNNLKPGDVLLDPAFCSTTFKKADKFSIQNDTGDNSLKIMAPKGTKGIVASIGFVDEQEFILPRNSALEYVGDDSSDGSKVFRLKQEAIEEPQEERHGGSFEFISPNVDHLDFSNAVSGLNSKRQTALREASNEIDKALDLKGETVDVVGAWSDGAENTVMDIHSDTKWTDWPKVALSASMKGWLADQKSVLAFQEIPNRKPRESRHIEGDGGGKWLGQINLDVEINPTENEILDLADDYKNVRISIDPDGNMFAWNARDAIHDQVSTAIGFEQKYSDIWTLKNGRLASANGLNPENYLNDPGEQERFKFAREQVRKTMSLLVGNSALLSFDVKGNLADIHKNLTADGLEFHTLVPSKDGATVYTAAVELKDVDATLTATKKAAKRYGAKINIRRGRGEFIGDTLGTGSDREQRDRARESYAINIERSTVRSGKAIWQGVRDRWGKDLEVVGADQLPIAAREAPDQDPAFERLHARGGGGRFKDMNLSDDIKPTGETIDMGYDVYKKRVQTLVDDVVTRMNFDPKKIKIDPGMDRTGGLVEGSADPNTGIVTLHPLVFAMANRSDDYIKGTVAHEVFHQKYFDLYKANHDRVQRIKNDPKLKQYFTETSYSTPDELDPYIDEKYPSVGYTFDPDNIRKMLKTGGKVSGYAAEWAERGLKKNVDHMTLIQAENEVLAEIARVDMMLDKSVSRVPKEWRTYYDKLSAAHDKLSGVKVMKK